MAMDEKINRAQQLLRRSRDVIIEVLLAALSAAITFCHIAKHHGGEEQIKLLNEAHDIYCRVEEFCSRREIVDTRISERMHRLKNELAIPTKSRHRTRKSRSAAHHLD